MGTTKSSTGGMLLLMGLLSHPWRVLAYHWFISKKLSWLQLVVSHLNMQCYHFQGHEETLRNIWQVMGIARLWPWAAAQDWGNVFNTSRGRGEVRDECVHLEGKRSKIKWKTKTDESTRLRNEWKSPKLIRLFNDQDDQAIVLQMFSKAKRHLYVFFPTFETSVVKAANS